jgi:hypothetical protein
MPSVDSGYDSRTKEFYNPLAGMTVTPPAPTPTLSGVGQYQTVDPGFTRSAAA